MKNVIILFCLLCLLFIMYLVCKNNNTNYVSNKDSNIYNKIIPKGIRPSEGDQVIKSTHNLYNNDYGIPLKEQKSIVGNQWDYLWGEPPYGTIKDQVGILQIVNGGTQPIWITYGGLIITDPNNKNNWKKYIETPSSLNNKKNYKVYERKEGGQGLTFKLDINNYQLLPFTGSSAWVSGSLGCCDDGSKCTINTKGRSGGTGVNDQPSTLFEWTVPGVWDASAVDGFNIPIKFEIDGCIDQNNNNICNGSDSVVNLLFSRKDCVNPILSNGIYLGCKSMCACQNSNGSDCPDYKKDFINQPHTPGGYCGCDEKECVEYSHKLFGSDPAGIAYCDSITKMTKNESGKRNIYCQAYDDAAGTKSYGNGIIKLTMFNTDFDIPPKSNCTTPPTPPTNCCEPNTNCTTWCCDTQVIVNGSCPVTEPTDQCSRKGTVYNSKTSGDGNPTCGQRYEYSAINKKGLGQKEVNYWNNVICNSPNSTGDLSASKICYPCYKGDCTSDRCCNSGEKCSTKCCDNKQIIKDGICQLNPTYIPICSDYINNNNQCNNKSKYINAIPNKPPSSWGCSPLDNGLTNPFGTNSCINKNFQN